MSAKAKTPVLTGAFALAEMCLCIVVLRCCPDHGGELS